MSTIAEGPEERKAAPGSSDAGSPARGGPELRGAPRFSLLLRVAKIIADGREQFCVIRDASVTGLKIRLFAPLPAHADLAVEMANGERHQVHCAWTTGDHAGLHFVMPVVLERLLDESRGSGGRKQVRLRIALEGLLHSGGKAHAVAFRDISQQGAGLTCEKWLMHNELVKIDTPILPQIFAKVRWRDHPHYGIIFEQTFQLEDIARRCAGLPAPIIAGGDHAQTSHKA